MSAAAPLAAAHDLLVLDLDGVLYVGRAAVPGAVEALAAAGLPTGFATNNASRTPQEVAEHLSALGIPARPEQVTTSSQAGARLVRSRAGEDARVLPVGGPGVRAALEELGLAVADDPAGSPDAVLQGFGRHLGWSDLCDVVVAVQGGALWVATNTDLTIPTERGTMPGNGSLVSVVRRAVDVDPLVAGKPEPAIFRVVAERARAQRPLVVGDRLDTDIAGAVAAGLPSLLVLTGVSSPQDLFAAPPPLRPTHVGADLHALGEHSHPLADLPRDGGGWRCGEATATVAGTTVSVSGRGEGTAGLLDQLRAGVAAAWSLPPGAAAADEGLAAVMGELRRRCAVHP